MTRVAIATDGNQVSPHFGHCTGYTVVDIEGGRVLDKKIVDNPGHKPGHLPLFLHEHGVNRVIAGGIGHRAQLLFAEQGIETVVGVSGDIDDVLDILLNGSLVGGVSSCRHGSEEEQAGEEKLCDHGKAPSHGNCR